MTSSCAWNTALCSSRTCCAYLLPRCDAQQRRGKGRHLRHAPQVVEFCVFFLFSQSVSHEIQTRRLQADNLRQRDVSCDRRTAGRQFARRACCSLSFISRICCASIMSLHVSGSCSVEHDCDYSKDDFSIFSGCTCRISGRLASNCRRARARSMSSTS